MKLKRSYRQKVLNGLSCSALARLNEVEQLDIGHGPRQCAILVRGVFILFYVLW